MAVEHPEHVADTVDMVSAARASEEDLQRARLAWRRDAPPYFKFLLEAEPVEDI